MHIMNSVREDSGPTQTRHAAADDARSSKILLVMEYVEGGPVVLTSGPQQRRLSEAIARKFFRDALQVQHAIQAAYNCFRAFQMPQTLCCCHELSRATLSILLMRQELIMLGNTARTHKVGLILRACLQGIDYMHSMGMTHGDIKPDNLLLGADGRVRICDFGSAQQLGAEDVMIRTVGTPAFFSPEMCDGRPYSARGADAWALGVCLYIFVFGALPPPQRACLCFTMMSTEFD